MKTGTIDGQRVRLTLKNGQPQRTGNEYSINLEAELLPTGRGGRLDYNHLFIQFKQDTRPIEGPLEIDEDNGNVTITATVSMPGAYSFSAQVIVNGSPGLEDTVVVSVQGSSVTLPETFDGRVTGPDGHPTFRFSVTPAVRIKGTIVNETTDETYAIETNALGVGIYPDRNRPNEEGNVHIKHSERTTYTLFFPNTKNQPAEPFPLEAPLPNHGVAHPDDWGNYGLWRRLGWRLRHNKSCRWAFYCLLSLLCLVALFWFCLIGDSASGIPQITQEQYKEMRPTAQALTQTMRVRRGLPPVPVEQAHHQDSIVCSVLWWMWCLCTLWFCIVGFFRTFSDLFAIMWRILMKTVRERRQGSAPVPTAARPQQGQGAQGQTNTTAPAPTEKVSFWREVRAAIVGEWAAESAISLAGALLRRFR